MKSPIVLLVEQQKRRKNSEKKAEQNVETKLDSGKQEKKENAVEGWVKTLEPIALRKHFHMSS